MGLFDTGSSSTLADVLGQQAATQTSQINQDYAKRKRQNVSQQAATGRLGSGVANYQAGDLASSQLGDLGGVQSNLANALAGIPTQDYLGTQEFNRSSQLARLIAELNKPSDLQTAFGALGAAGKVGGTIAAFV